MNYKEAAEKFQCPGCVCGCDTSCGKYVVGIYNTCVSHVLGTHLGLGNKIALGMPKGFNKPGFVKNDTRNDMDIWFSDVYQDSWDYLNIPVWYMDYEGCLFVRVYSPRTNFGRIEVYLDMSSENVKKHLLRFNAMNVAEFLDKID